MCLLCLLVALLVSFLLFVRLFVSLFLGFRPPLLIVVVSLFVSLSLPSEPLSLLFCLICSLVSCMFVSLLVQCTLRKPAGPRTNAFLVLFICLLCLCVLHKRRAA